MERKGLPGPESGKGEMKAAERLAGREEPGREKETEKEKESTRRREKEARSGSRETVKGAGL